MGHGRKKTASFIEIAPIPQPTYNVTGDITPDAKCNYFEAGIYNGYPYYKRADSDWFLWSHSAGIAHYMTQILGVWAAPYWAKFGLTWTGNYNPVAPAIGIAVVAIGGH